MSATEQISPQSKDEDRQLLLDHLRNTLDRFMATTNIPERAATVSLREGSWSILQITEHLTLVERGMIKRLRESGGNLNPLDTARDQAILNGTVDRSKPRNAPEHVLPQGRYPSLAEAKAELKQRRQENIAFVESYAGDLRAKWVKHPVGEMDGHQLILLMSSHLLRHVAQVEEIKNSPAYKTALEQKAAS
jgi:uncharacterized damage-inducible protein DinB